MAYNSMNDNLKRIYATLNPGLREKVFPNGENEFISVGNFLNQMYKEKDLVTLIKIYSSVYTYYNLTMGNSARAYFYAREKSRNVLNDDDEVVGMVALITLQMVSGKSMVAEPMKLIVQYKEHINNYIDTVIAISENPEIFNTKEKNAGTLNNPILVDGVKGVGTYLENVAFKTVDLIHHERTQTLYLEDNTTGISYAIDEYTIENMRTGKVMGKLWFNVYGTENCKIAPNWLTCTEQ